MRHNLLRPRHDAHSHPQLRWSRQRPWRQVANEAVLLLDVYDSNIKRS